MPDEPDHDFIVHGTKVDDLIAQRNLAEERYVEFAIYARGVEYEELDGPGPIIRAHGVETLRLIVSALALHQRP